MNFSNLNPRNWFRREDPSKPIPQADGQPKYKVGQHCLVIKYTGFTKFIGQEVILLEVFNRFMGGDGATVGEWAWVTDLSEPYTRADGTKTRLVFPEAWMIPLDDEDLNEELRNELIDDFGTKQVQLDEHLKRLDQVLEDLSNAIQRKKQAI